MILSVIHNITNLRNKLFFYANRNSKPARWALNVQIYSNNASEEIDDDILVYIQNNSNENLLGDSITGDDLDDMHRNNLQMR